ncbi:TatD family hydrolase [Pelagibius litoralis]|uniref:TatD family hydrolase n=1 Tax=Pelagibius litoralis TaxID=374515 RepID=A0A967C711_9PROT|nr:TatD family hydrolase [Pelagibius litoralis]NIA67752.1 TatD family hydrolase [Pelagibius litoralis]
MAVSGFQSAGEGTGQGLVDSHCHLDYLAKDGDLAPVVERAEAAGVSTLVTICTKISEFDEIRSIAERFPSVFCSVGVHPHEAGTEGQENAERLLSLAAHDKVVGIGETGLDYYYEHSPREAQQVSFRAHISASRESRLPLIVHARDADDDTVAILQEEYAKGPFPGVIHCFTAGPELARAALEIGFYISLAGIVTFKSAQALRDTVAEVPLDRLLVETDSPYLAPVPKRGKTNEPANVAYTAAALAALRGLPEDDFAAMTTENFFRLFTRAQPR